jgi:hypothetical protein
VDGVAAVAALPMQGGGAWLGGSRADGCNGERKATVIALDAGLKPRTLYVDDTLGASEVRALAPLPHGRLFVAAYKESLFDYRPATAPTGAAGVLAGRRSYSTLVLALDQGGRATPPKPLDAGADVLPTAALADDDGGDLLLGGSLAGQAAIFHLSFRPPEGG